MTNKTSEQILDQLAQGENFASLKARHGLTRQDLIKAAVMGVSELQSEYIELMKKHGKFKHLHKTL